MTERTKQMVTVPMSMASLTIPTDSISFLPIGAEYRNHNGQASVSVRRKAATDAEPERIIVYATCDSLQLLCESYERTISSLKSRLVEHQQQLASMTHESMKQEEVEQPPNGFLTSLKWCLIGFAIGMIASKSKTIISKIKKS
ncbi:MAG: hypothetical protein KBT34_12660 [Prevotella sp.]|nr:hypothetical protein [Candidatus Prevotella equi]